MLSYVKHKEQYDLLWDKYTTPRKRANMTADEVNAMWKLQKVIQQTQDNFLKYCYPTLRSQEMKLDGGVTPIFNINLGAPDPKLKSANPASSDKSDEAIDI
jgi:hypothetical protein